MNKLTETQQQEIIDGQVSRWKEEMRAIADKITVATGKTCAAVIITGTDEDYPADVHPQLIVEDALRVNPHGWPHGFNIELLNKNE